MQCTSRWAMARGHRLNTSIVLAAVHGLSGLFRAVSAVEPSLCRPLPTLSPSLISHLASVDVKATMKKTSGPQSQVSLTFGSSSPGFPACQTDPPPGSHPCHTSYHTPSARHTPPASLPSHTFTTPRRKPTQSHLHHTPPP